MPYHGRLSVAFIRIRRDRFNRSWRDGPHRREVTFHCPVDLVRCYAEGDGKPVNPYIGAFRTVVISTEEQDLQDIARVLRLIAQIRRAFSLEVGANSRTDKGKCVEKAAEAHVNCVSGWNRKRVLQLAPSHM